MLADKLPLLTVSPLFTFISFLYDIVSAIVFLVICTRAPGHAPLRRVDTITELTVLYGVHNRCFSKIKLFVSEHEKKELKLLEALSTSVLQRKVVQ